MIDFLRQNIKNIYGWRTKRKIVVITVDDYGTVRTASKKARENMKKAGLKMLSHFDHYDTLEDEEDLLSLYDVLSSVKDKNGKHAVITAFALSANIDFEKVIESNYTKYHYELLPETFSKLKGYENVYDLWKEGIDKKLLIPQFHGREHLNLNIFKQLLKEKDKQIMVNIANRSYSAIDDSIYPTMIFTAAFDFYDFKENESFKEIIVDGLNTFERVYGFRATHFNPPGASENHILHKTLAENGIKYINQLIIKTEHQGKGRYKKIINYTGKKTKEDQTILVRNSVFEPTMNRNKDCASRTLKLIETAFRWHKPAIIVSHRVNFAGHIDPNNRKSGLIQLKKILKEIIKRWPDVEFMAANELAEEIEKQKR